MFTLDWMVALMCVGPSEQIPSSFFESQNEPTPLWLLQSSPRQQQLYPVYQNSRVTDIMTLKRQTSVMTHPYRRTAWHPHSLMTYAWCQKISFVISIIVWPCLIVGFLGKCKRDKSGMWHRKAWILMRDALSPHLGNVHKIPVSLLFGWTRTNQLVRLAFSFNFFRRKEFL